MPFNFSGQSHSTVAKLGVVADGDTFVGAPTVLKSGATATLTQAATTTTLTGGAGFVSGDTGKFIYISGAATSANNGWQGPITFVSATSVTWTNASGATDANNGHISWSESTLAVSTLMTGQSAHSAFTGPPVRSGVGLWSITTKDNVVATLDLDINTVLASGSFWAQQLPDQTIALTGQKKYSWMFHSATAPGVAADLPYPGSCRLYLVYTDMKVGV
jgi:hypothetical protein